MNLDSAVYCRMHVDGVSVHMKDMATKAILIEHIVYPIH